MDKITTYALLGMFVFAVFSNAAVSTSWAPEAREIPYQVNHSDRIVIGTVKELHTGFENTDVIISVDEWLKNPLLRNEITVVTERGSFRIIVGAANFSVGEKVLLMLKDENVKKGKFSMPFMELGKRPVSDRDAVIKEIAALPESTSSATVPQTPGFEAILAVGLLPSIIYVMKRRKN